MKKLLQSKLFVIAGMFIVGVAALAATTISANDTELVVRASGSLANNIGPKFMLRVNEVVIADVEVKSTTGQDYTFKLANSIGRNAKIDVVFYNDEYVNGQDRNLIVDSIKVNGRVIPSTGSGVVFDRGVGAQAFDNLDVLPGRRDLLWNGALRFRLRAIPTPLPQPPVPPSPTPVPPPATCKVLPTLTTISACPAGYSGSYTITQTFNSDPKICAYNAAIDDRATACTLLPPVTPPSTGSLSDIDAVRFLAQASFGANESAVAEVKSLGVQTWLDRQVALPISSHGAYIDSVFGKGEAVYSTTALESFWKQALTGQDQLRQRVAFALSQIMVVSTVDQPFLDSAYAISSYHDMLTRNALGNFRTLLLDVALHPSMGVYLSHLGNQKVGADGSRQPDENFAREVMQLFSIGLWRLNPDGTRVLDANGNPIPTYGQADVRALARVFTGLSWGACDASTDACFVGYTHRTNVTFPQAFRTPMQAFERYHDSDAKSLLGKNIPSGQTTLQDVNAAVDILFNHPNVGPFIASQLIRRFVTSNPSLAYVQRVATVFNANTQGVRGDMKAVIRAVLSDAEARDASRVTQADLSFGKFREPLLKLAAFLRATNAVSRDGRYRIWYLSSPIYALGQNPFGSQSVFNFYSPAYRTTELPNGWVAPELQIINEATITSSTNFFSQKISEYREGAVPPNDTDKIIYPDYRALAALAGTPRDLVNALDRVLLYGTLGATSRVAITDAVAQVSINNDGGVARAQTAMFLVLASPDFAVQR